MLYNITKLILWFILIINRCWGTELLVIFVGEVLLY